MNSRHIVQLDRPASPGTDPIGIRLPLLQNAPNAYRAGTWDMRLPVNRASSTVLLLGLLLLGTRSRNLVNVVLPY